MGKLNLAILDGDERYMENLADYITGYYRHRFNLSTFTGVETLLSRVREDGADIVLIAADKYGEWIAKLESGLVVLLSDGAPSGELPADDNITVAPIGGVAPSGVTSSGVAPFGVARPARVDRYSGADKLVADILKIYSSDDRLSADSDAISGGRENKIFTVFSAEGGSGRTSVAIALCAHFVRQKLRALYIGLDFMSAGDFAPAGEKDGGLSDIIYTIKTRPEKLGLKLEALGRTAPGHGFFYFNPPIYPMDIDEIQPADVEILIARLRGAGLYDRVVIDTHSGLSLRNKTLMELTDGIFIIARGNAAGQKKLYQYKDQIDKCFGEQAGDIYKRCHIILDAAQSPDSPENSGDPYDNTGWRENGSDLSVGAGRLPSSATATAKATAGKTPATAELTAAAEDAANAFSAKVTIIPYCGAICDDYRPETLADHSNAFGAALAEAARRT